MKAHQNIIRPQDLPGEVKKHLSHLIMEHDIELIFLSREHLCTLPTLTVITGKSTGTVELEKLQNRDWVRNSMGQYNLIISISSHLGYPQYSDLHFSYVVFNCHPRHLIFARSAKSWNSRFQNEYSFNRHKYQNRFKEWSDTVETKCTEYRTKFIAPYPDLQSPDLFRIAVKEICVELLSGFRTFFLPKSRHEGYEGLRILDFMIRYVPGMQHLLRKCSLHTLSKILDPSGPETTGDFHGEALAITETLLGVFSVNLPNMFNRNLLRTLAWNQYDLLYKKEPLQPAQLETEDSEQLVTLLVENFKIDFIYLLGRKDLVSGQSGFLLLILGPAVKINHSYRLKDLIENKFPQIKASALIHKTEWIKKHYSVFHGFVDRYMTVENLLYQNRRTITFPPSAETCRDTLVRQYWEARKVIISAHWNCLGIYENDYSESHLMHLRGIFQQICFGVLYHFTHYVPNTTNTNYLWDLVEWFAPDMASEILTADQITALHSLISRQEINFPQAGTAPAAVPSSQFLEAIRSCSALYAYINEKMN